MEPGQLSKLLSQVRKIINSISSVLNTLLLLGPVECSPSVPEGQDTHVLQLPRNLDFNIL